jgi:hypothetical protein
MLRCVQIATPSVPYFRSFAITDQTRTNWPLHFYIYRYTTVYVKHVNTYVHTDKQLITAG